MIVKAYPPQMTPEQFEQLRDSRGLELVDGIVKEKNMGTENATIQSLIAYYLNAVVRPAKLGWVLDSEAMYHCFPNNAKQIRQPDVSFILSSRLPPEGIPRGRCTLRPDIAVEVVSPNDLCEDLEVKLVDYFAAEIPLLWIVTPRTRTVLVYKSDGTARRLRDTDNLTADPIIPNFCVRIADLFPNPPEPAPATPTEPT
jgi:Uma2 family endonuclease